MKRDMTREEVLTKAVAIAKRNGYDISDAFFEDIPTDFWTNFNHDLYFSILFDHNFARNFWGENVYIEFFDHKTEYTVDLVESKNPIAALILFNKKSKIQIPSWQFHLLQMVISEDPIEYLKDFLDDKDKTKTKNEQ